MKSILYAGAALMISASIYGFVDYKKTNSTKEFRKMYEQKEVLQPAVIEEKGLLPVPVEPSVEKTKKVFPANEEKNENKAAKQKKLNSELFSRAPLKDHGEIKQTPKIRKKKIKE